MLFPHTKNMDTFCSHVYTVNDIHSGDMICVNCGLILMERLIFENECPDAYSKTSIETHDLYDDTLISNEIKGNKNRTKMFDRINTQAMSVFTTDAIVSKWLGDYLLPRDVNETVKSILSDIVNTGDYNHIAGTNRRGVLSACIYMASLLHEHTCSKIELYTLLNIKSVHFYYGRRFLYEWNQKNHLCDWFFKI